MWGWSLRLGKVWSASNVHGRAGGNKGAALHLDAAWQCLMKNYFHAAPHTLQLAKAQEDCNLTVQTFEADPHTGSQGYAAPVPDHFALAAGAQPAF